MSGKRGELGAPVALVSLVSLALGTLLARFDHARADDRPGHDVAGEAQFHPRALELVEDRHALNILAALFPDRDVRAVEGWPPAEDATLVVNATPVREEALVVAGPERRTAVFVTPTRFSSNPT